MINSHPSLSQVFRQNSALDCVQARRYASRPAQKRRFIKPNKTGDPEAHDTTAAIGALPSWHIAIALLKCRESCRNATTKTKENMTIGTALTLLGIAALAAVLLIGVGFHRAGKAIEVLRCAREEDKK